MIQMKDAHQIIQTAQCCHNLPCLNPPSLSRVPLKHLLSVETSSELINFSVPMQFTQSASIKEAFPFVSRNLKMSLNQIMRSCKEKVSFFVESK